MGTSFTDLLSNNHITIDDNWGGTSELKNDQGGNEAPKFKSVPPASLPLSPISPSSYLAFPSNLSPAEFLISPSFLASPNIFSTPTSEAFTNQNFNWRNSSSEEQQRNKDKGKNYSDFSFQTQAKPASLFQSSSNIFQAQEALKKQETWRFNEPIKHQTNFSSESMATNSKYPLTQSFTSQILTAAKPNIQGNSNPESGYFNCSNVPQTIREKRRAEDGYNWRKYGQKQLKGNDNPRGYYKCTYPNCSMRKKVERSLLDGQITEIVYKGSHNHPKPQSTRRTSSQAIQPSSSCTNSGISDQSVMTLGNIPPVEPISVHDYPSVSVEEEDFEQTSRNSYSGGDHDDDFVPEAKRWKGENDHDSYPTSGSRTVREPRVVVQTTSEIDILDDGYRWRKYGQKVVKGNPNPRSYYKCTSPGCSVRKHVERAAHDLKAVITTYEGKHNHDVPPARGSGSYNINRPSLNSNISIAPAPMKPSAVTNYSRTSSFTNSLYNTRQPTSETQEPIPLKMLPSPAGFGYSTFGISLGSHAQFSDAAYSKARDERKDESFLESFLSKNF